MQWLDLAITLKDLASSSPLAVDLSKAILDTKVEEKIEEINLKWFSNKTNCQIPGSTASQDSLTIDSFRGLFLITIVTSLVALLIFFCFFIHENVHILRNTNSDGNTSILQRLVKLAVLFYQEDKSCSNPEQPHEQGQVSSISSREHQIIEATHQTPENGNSSTLELEISPSNASMDLDANIEIRHELLSVCSLIQIMCILFSSIILVLINMLTLVNSEPYHTVLWRFW